MVASRENAAFAAALTAKGEVVGQWALANPGIVAGGRMQMIACADEADMSIYRICTHFSAQGYRTLVFSQDSDFNFIPSYLDVAGTIRFDKWMRIKRKESNKPWTLVNNTSLQRYDPLWSWTTDYGRVAAVMMAGHDYLPRGIRNVGLLKLSTARCLANVSFGRAQCIFMSDKPLHSQVNDLGQLMMALAGYGFSRPDSHWSNAAVETLINDGEVSQIPVTLVRAIAACVRYAHHGADVRSQIAIPDVAADQQQGIDVDVSDRTTFRFPRRRAAPKVPRIQTPGEKAFHNRSGRRPGRQANVLINPGVLGHRPYPDLHLSRVEAHRYSTTPPGQLALYDPNIDLDDEAEQVQRNQFMIDQGKTRPPKWAPKAAEKREQMRAEWEDGLAPAAARTPGRGQDDEEDGDDGDDQVDTVAAATRGAWDIVTLPLVLSSSLNFFHPAEAGVRNPLYHLFLLLPAFWIEYSNVVVDVFNIYTQILTTDQRLLEVWRYRSSRGNMEWLRVARELVNLLSISTAHFPNVDRMATEAEYLPKWSHYGETQVDGVHFENIAFRANLKLYCDEFGVFDHQGAALLREARVAENLDPALVFAVIKYRRAAAAGFAIPPLKVNGLTDLTVWQGGIRNLWNSLAAKLKSANLRAQFEEEIEAKTKAAADGQRVSSSMLDSITRGVFDISHRHTDSPARVERWIDQLLEGAGCKEGFLNGLRPWLRQVAMAFHTRATRSSHYSSLEMRLTTMDPDIRVLEMVPFFAYLGMDISLVSLHRNGDQDYASTLR